MPKEHNQNQHPDSIDDGHSIMIFHHIFFALIYGGIGILIGIFVF